MVKEQYRETATAARLSEVSFGMQSPVEMERCAHLQVVSKNLYNQDAQRSSVVNGVLDHRMGTSQKDVDCLTCGKGLADCVGHFGFVNLELPVFHVGYFRAVIQVLQCVCKACSRILLPPAVAAAFRQKLRRGPISYLAKKALRKKIIDLCKKVTTCPTCRATNGVVKKCGLLKISHEPYRAHKRTGDIVQNALAEYERAAEGNREIESLVSSSGLVRVLNPLEVLEIFERIPTEDVPLLLMNQETARPANM